MCLCGGYLLNRKQKISPAGFIINFRVAPIHRKMMLDSTHKSLFYEGPLITAIYVTEHNSSDPWLPAGCLCGNEGGKFLSPV